MHNSRPGANPGSGAELGLVERLVERGVCSHVPVDKI
jgi:hypothetical protein